MIGLGLSFLFSFFSAITFLYNTSVNSYKITNKTLPTLVGYNFSDALSSYDIVVINFYSPTCTVCRELECFFAEVHDHANEFQRRFNKTLYVAKVNAEEDQRFIQTYSIYNYPMVVVLYPKYEVKWELYNLFDNNVEGVFKFIDERINHKWADLNDLGTFTEFHQSTKSFLFMCGDRNHPKVEPFFETLLKYPNHFDGMKLGWANSTEVIEFLGCNLTESRPYNMFLFKNFDEPQLEYLGDYNEKLLDSWVSTFSTPIVLNLDDDHIQMVFRDKIPTLIFLYHNENSFHANNITELKETYGIFNEAGRKYRRKLMFLQGNTKDDYISRAYMMFGLKPNDLPAVVGIKVEGVRREEINMLKFRLPEGVNITKNSLEDLVGGMLNDTLEPYFISAPLPEKEFNEEENVYNLVGANFNKLIFENVDDDIVFFLYDPDSEICKGFREKILTLAYKAKNIVNNIRFYIYDSSLSEFPKKGLTSVIGNYGFYFLKQGVKTVQSFTYMKEKASVESIARFISSQSVINKNFTTHFNFSEEDKKVVEETTMDDIMAAAAKKQKEKEEKEKLEGKKEERKPELVDLSQLESYEAYKERTKNNPDPLMGSNAGNNATNQHVNEDL